MLECRENISGTFTAFHLPAPSICPPVHFLKINVGGTSPQLNDPFGLFVPPLRKKSVVPEITHRCVSTSKSWKKSPLVWVVGIVLHVLY